MMDYAEINKKIGVGGVVLLPTETVYGLACSALNTSAVEKIYTMKGRDFQKTLAVCIKDLREAQTLGVFTPKALDLAKRYWPGSLTLIVESKNNASIDGRCLARNGGKNTIAFRCPEAKWREHLNGPLALTSANKSGQADCTDHDDAVKIFGNAIDGSITTNASLSGLPSTILLVVDEAPRILRQGVLEVEL